VRNCSPELFQSFAAQQKIILRGFGGPEEKMSPVYDEAASRLSLRPPLAEQVIAFLQRLGTRPVVGVHLRRGDFPLLSEEAYDLHQALFSAVPLWWYEGVMHAILQRQPDTCFLLCHNGAADAVATLKKKFTIVEMPAANPYKSETGHQSPHHPVADLFALACCPVILASPVSSFSHYAANVLGSESTCLIPPSQMKKGVPTVVRVRVYRQLLRRWIDAACIGNGTEILPSSLDNVDFSQKAQFKWIQCGDDPV